MQRYLFRRIGLLWMNRSHIFAHCIFNPHYSVFLVVCLTNVFHILCPVPLHNKYSIGILINIKQSLNSDLHFATKLPFVSLLWYVLFCRRVLFQTFFDSIARMLNMILYYKTKKLISLYMKIMKSYRLSPF